MNLVISKPLMITLVFTSVLTSIVLLKPAPLTINTDPPRKNKRTYIGHDIAAVKIEKMWLRKPIANWTNPIKTSKKKTPPFASSQNPSTPSILKPITPAPPFKYLGKMDDHGKVSIFLSDGENPFSASKGDTIDSTWEVGDITSSHVELIYLPLGESKQIFFN